MFKAFYGLNFDPFQKNIDIKHYFNSNDFSQAINRLEFLKKTLGIGVITGEPGVGKSFLIRYFANSLNQNLYKCVYIPISTLTVMDFYRSLCLGLGIIPMHKKVDMFKQIQDTIYTLSHSKNIIPVIILDEAQFLKNSILDDIRIIFNFEADSKDLCALLFCAQSSFIDRLNLQTHEPLRQRISVNYYLKGLSRLESIDYVKSRLKIAGCSEPIFSQDALELLFSSTNGCVRTLNALAKMSLVHGANEKAMQIDTEIIYNAQEELNIIA